MKFHSSQFQPIQTVGVNREHTGGDSVTTEKGVAIMADDKANGGGEAAEQSDDINVADFTLSRRQIEAKGKKAGTKIERARIKWNSPCVRVAY